MSFLRSSSFRKPSRVEHADIAGAQPAVGGEHAFGLVGTPPIALHDLRAAHPDLALSADREDVAGVVADGHFGRRHRQADGAELRS